jgi:chromosome partitioning protein
MRTIAIVNQKGGCGKTTTAISLSAFLALSNRKVLLIDLDPQSHASIGLNIKVEDLAMSAYDIFDRSKEMRLEDVMVPVADRFDLVPSQVILSAVEQELAGRPGRESILLQSVQKMGGSHDYLIVDCPPNLGMLTINALRACSEALIPIDMSVFSLQGVARLMEVVELLKTSYGHEITCRAIATMFDTRTRFAAELLGNIETYFGDRVYKTIIHATVKMREAAGFGLPITAYNQRCRGAMDYQALAEEVIAGEKKGVGRVKSAYRVAGPQQTAQGVIFTYYDPAARNVQIAGDFSNWKPLSNPPVSRGKEGVWRVKLALNPGRYQYKYIVDGQWKIDPNNDDVITSETGVSNSSLQVS